MPRKTNRAATADKAVLQQIPAELLAQLIPGPATAAPLEAVFQRFKKAFTNAPFHIAHVQGEFAELESHRNSVHGRCTWSSVGPMRRTAASQRATVTVITA